MSLESMPPVMPLFDAIHLLEDGNHQVNQHITNITLNVVPDAALVYEYAVAWLSEQRHRENNYKSYRSELTTFLHWCFDVEQVSLAAVSRRVLVRYFDYCQHPPSELIAYHNVAQFRNEKAGGERMANPAWRPFLGKKQLGEIQPYQLNDNSLQTKLAILSAFYHYLIAEEYTERNPAIMLMKAGHATPVIQQAGDWDEVMASFSELQWSYVMTTVEKLADTDPEQHERSLFLLSLMYGCYLRISEVAARPGFSPVMGQFRRDQKSGVWGFHIPLSKGGKRRTVAVSDQLLAALERYRGHLGLSRLPRSGENNPLFIRHRPAGRGRQSGLLNANLGIRQLREMIYGLFELAADAALADGFDLDAQEMRNMTPHSIRHTGISHDINLNGRPLSHVQADAGHDSIDTTSQYLHTSRVERHESAARKPLDRLKGVG